MSKKTLRSHEWKPIETSRGVWGYHEFVCKNCGKTTHIGLDIDYGARECPGKSPQGPSGKDEG
jgi:hypothetical protein